MITPEYVRLMARYARWQNDSIIAAADQLTQAQRRADEGLFFGSVHRTLNHLLWGDQVWAHRLAGTRAPRTSGIGSSVELHDTWQAYKADRRQTDDEIQRWAESGEIELEGDLAWHSGSLNATVSRPRWTLIVQLFNHGTHHRGQVHGVLTRHGIPTEDTDVQYLP